MIKVEKMVPGVYYNKSRDFQLFGRLYEIIFNYLKNNVEEITDLTKNLTPNQSLLKLMCNTLGFKTTHDYDNEQLSALCSIFLQCVKSKGTVKSIELLLKMVCSVENSQGEPEVIENYDNINSEVVNIYIPSDVKDLTLIRDVLNYIIPAGVSYILTHKTLEKTKVSLDLGSDITNEVDRKEFSWNPVTSSILKITNNGSTTSVVNHNLKIDGWNESGEPSGYSVDTEENPNICESNGQLFDIRNYNMSNAEINEHLKDTTDESGN